MTVPSPAFYLSQANTEFGGNKYATDILSKAGVGAPRLLSALAGKSAWTHTAVFATYGGRPYANGLYGYGTPGSVSPLYINGKPIDYLDTGTNTLVVAIQEFLTPGSLTCSVTVEGLGSGSGTCDSLSFSVNIPGIQAFLQARLGVGIKMKMSIT